MDYYANIMIYEVPFSFVKGCFCVTAEAISKQPHQWHENNSRANPHHPIPTHQHHTQHSTIQRLQGKTPQRLSIHPRRGCPRQIKRKRKRRADYSPTRPSISTTNHTSKSDMSRACTQSPIVDVYFPFPEREKEGPTKGRISAKRSVRRSKVRDEPSGKRRGENNKKMQVGHVRLGFGPLRSF
jgi:hypothetical protein